VVSQVESDQGETRTAAQPVPDIENETFAARLSVETGTAFIPWGKFPGRENLISICEQGRN
jgi:hypothetical protein